MGGRLLTAVLLDTHTWAWSITRDRRLSRQAFLAIEQADTVFVSPISLFEIGLKVRAGRWPEMAAVIDDLLDYLERQDGRVAALSPSVCLAAGRLDGPHRDPFDRLLAATALHHDVPLVSADAAFDGTVARIW